MKLIVNWHAKVFLTVLILFSLLLVFIANSLSISYKEAIIFFEDTSLLHYLIHISTTLFGENNIALRVPFILFYVLSVIYMYKLTANYFKNESDRLISIFIFMFLPGILGASLLVNSSIIVIFCVVYYLYYYKTQQQHNYYLLFAYAFIDNSFAVLYLALFFYAFFNKQEHQRLLWISLGLFALSMYVYGFETSGKPKSHFLDMFAIYASIFSPVIFLYFFYSIYRIGLKGKKSLYWFVSTTALAFSLLLSFRQRIYIEDFAPFVVVAIPLMMKLFFHSLRVRLPMFRKKYYALTYTALFLLFVNVFVILFNKPLYLVLNDTQKHFVYPYHFAKEIALILKDNDINEIASNDKELLLRLKFYGIESGKKHFISLQQLNLYDAIYEISYFNKQLISIYHVQLQE
jgi:4-amino-4-deoxy-L-arabinose transferase-like glycosyltransferase